MASVAGTAVAQAQLMPVRLVGLTILTLILLVPPSAEGRQVEREPADRAVTVGELERLIDSQRQLIEAQGRRLDELQRQLEEMRARIDPAGAASPTAAPAQAETHRKPQLPDLPPDVIVAGDFPGSIRIPGTDTAVKVGGLVRVNWVTTFDPLQVTDRFITSEIPVDVANAPVGGTVDVMAIPSRFNLDFRTPTGSSYWRAFIEGDFAGSGNTLRLRHAYGQWRRVLFGQTWSTFSDPEAEPDGIDFEGLNAMAHFRQPQVRWAWAAAKRVRVAFAMENGDAEVTGATAVNQRPDFVSRIRWEPRRGGHVQVAALFRTLRAYPSNASADIVGANGWGVNASGSLPSPFQSKRDLVLFQINSGVGIGHYITDLNSVGGQDGVYDATSNVLRALPARAGFVSYEHWWSAQVHSAFTSGVVDVITLDIQPSDALHRTNRYSGNMIWSPIPRLELVAELLYGVRINKDRHREGAVQLQIGSTFRF